MSDTTKMLIRIILILGLLAFGIGVFFTDNIIHYALGAAIGTAISAVRVALLERTLNRSLEMTPEDAQNYTRLHYSLRMLGIVAAAIIVVKVNVIDVIGFVIGLLLVQPAVYIHGLLTKNKGEQHE